MRYISLVGADVGLSKLPLSGARFMLAVVFIIGIQKRAFLCVLPMGVCSLVHSIPIL